MNCRRDGIRCQQCFLSGLKASAQKSSRSCILAELDREDAPGFQSIQLFCWRQGLCAAQGNTHVGLRHPPELIFTLSSVLSYILRMKLAIVMRSERCQTMDDLHSILCLNSIICWAKQQIFTFERLELGRFWHEKKNLWNHWQMGVKSVVLDTINNDPGLALWTVPTCYQIQTWEPLTPIKKIKIQSKYAINHILIYHWLVIGHLDLQNCSHADVGICWFLPFPMIHYWEFFKFCSACLSWLTWFYSQLEDNFLHDTFSNL